MKITSAHLFAIWVLWLLLCLAYAYALRAANPNAPGQLKKASGGLPPGLAKKGYVELTPGSSPGATPTPVTPTPAPTPTPTPPVLDGFGAPISGLTSAELAEFNAGRIQVVTPEEISGGLGVIFNQNSCFQCHNQPTNSSGLQTPGGPSLQTETRFKEGNGTFDLLHVQSIAPEVAEDTIPTSSVLLAHRRALQLFGLGLIEAIPDATIINNQSRNNGADGIFGRAVLLTDPVTTRIAGGTVFKGVPNRIGRFGWKNQQASLRAFSDDAESNELGESSISFPIDHAPHQNGSDTVSISALILGEPPGIAFDQIQDTPADPTVTESVASGPDGDRYTAFMQFLDFPPVLARSASAQRGAVLFNGAPPNLNCAACHMAAMMSGQSTISPALSFRNVVLWSDLLLHDMGTSADGIAQAGAGPTEMRTTPLAGARARGAFWHDSEEPDIRSAILRHAGEATNSVLRFQALSPEDQQAVIDFVNTL